MICLNDTDTLEAWSGTDAVVHYTVHGLVGATFTQLAAGVLGNVADVAIYTAAAPVSVVSVIFVNTDTSAATVNFTLDPLDGGNPRYQISKALSLGPAYSLHTDGATISILNPTGAIVYTYLAHTHDGDTLQPDAIVSDGGAFPFTTSGPITLTQNLIVPDSGNIGSVSDTDAIAIANDGNLTFSAQSAVVVRISDNDEVPNEETTIIEFDTEEIDIQNEHNIGTYTTTVSDAGRHQASFVVKYSEVIADGKILFVSIHKNGAEYTKIGDTTGVAINPGIGFSILMNLDANDTVDIRAHHNHGENCTLSAANCLYSLIKLA